MAAEVVLKGMCGLWLSACSAQDRLVKGMRKAKVRTLEGANAYLEQEYLPLWNERFTVQPASEVDAHRPLGQEHDLASILSYVEERVVGQDFTIRYGGKYYQVARQQIKAGLKGQRVRVEERLDGSLVAQWSGKLLRITVCEAARATAAAPVARKAGVKKSGKSGNPR